MSLFIDIFSLHIAYQKILLINNHLKGRQTSNLYLMFLGITQEYTLSNYMQYRPGYCNLSYNFLLVLFSSFQYSFQPITSEALYWLSWSTVQNMNLLMFLGFGSLSLMLSKYMIFTFMSFSYRIISSFKMFSVASLEKKTFLDVPAFIYSS